MIVSSSEGHEVEPPCNTLFKGFTVASFLQNKQELLLFNKINKSCYFLTNFCDISFRFGVMGKRFVYKSCYFLTK